MQPLAFDSETALIRPALLAPPPACFTWQCRGNEPGIIHARDAERLIEAWLRDDELILVGQNVAYDMGVICEAFPRLRPLVFRAYEKDRVTDTMIRQQLLDIAGGIYRGRHIGKGVFVKHEYTLEALAKRCAGIEVQKDGWRMSYAAFIDTPLADWPKRALEVQAEARERARLLRAALSNDPKNSALAKEVSGLEEMIASPPDQCLRYPLEDARATLAVYEAQEAHANPWLADQYRQARAAFALHLGSAWGLRTDERGVEILRNEVTAEMIEIEEELVQLGLVRANGSRDTKLAKARMIEVCRREGITLRRTDGHTDKSKDPGKRGCKKLDGTPLPDESDECEEHVCLDDDACRSTDDDVLVMYAELATLKKVLSNDVEALARGVQYPIHTRYGLAETGRTTSSKPNIQNWVRARKCKVCDGKGKVAA